MLTDRYQDSSAVNWPESEQLNVVWMGGPSCDIKSKPSQTRSKVVATMYKPLLLLLPACIYLLTLLPLPFIDPANLWKTDPYLRRKARVEKVCQDFRDQIEQDGEGDHPPDPNVLVSRKEKFFWCKVPKAASTSWKAYFLKQSGKGVVGMERWSGPQISSRFWKKIEKPANIFLKHSEAREVAEMDGFDSFITVSRVAKCQIFSHRVNSWMGFTPVQFKFDLKEPDLSSFAFDTRDILQLWQWDTLLSDYYQRTETDSLLWTTRNTSWWRKHSSGGNMDWISSESTGLNQTTNGKCKLLNM